MPSKRIEAAELKELAAAGGRQEMHLGSERLDRLADLLEVPTGGDTGPVELDAEVGFEAAPAGFPRLNISVSGELSLRCQRCLRAVAWPLRLTTRLTVVGSDEQAEQLAEPFDSIVMDADGLALDTIIEDEILAALPLAPVHEPGQCEQAGAAIENLDSDNETGQTYRPFAALATMVGGDERKED